MPLHAAGEAGGQRGHAVPPAPSSTPARAGRRGGASGGETGPPDTVVRTEASPARAGPAPTGTLTHAPAGGPDGLLRGSERGRGCLQTKHRSGLKKTRGWAWLCGLKGAATGGSPLPPRSSPVILGAVAQGKPPLDCSGSPRSKGSRGLGLYSRRGREEASRILRAGRRAVSAGGPRPARTVGKGHRRPGSCCCSRARPAQRPHGSNQKLPPAASRFPQLGPLAASWPGPAKPRSPLRASLPRPRLPRPPSQALDCQTALRQEPCVPPSG